MSEGRPRQSAGLSAENSASEAGTVERPLLTVLQNVDALYWRAAGEASDRVEAVEIRPRAYCVFNATPLEKYENYRLCLDRWRQDDSTPDLGPTLYNLIDGLVRFLGINRYSPHNTTQPRLLVDLMPEVYFRGSDALLRRLLSRKGFTAARRGSLLRRIRQRGSVYLAPLNAVYVREFRMTSAAEDATRFLHQACRGLPYRSALARGAPNRCNKAQAPALSSEDAFYLSVFEHALAYFGSRVLHPARPAFRDAELADLYELTHEDLEQETSLPFADAIEALDLIGRLRDFDRRNPRRAAKAGNNGKESFAAPECLAQALAFTSRQYDYVSERLGYLAGNDLYDAYVQGRLTPAAVRKLFLAHIHEPGIALEAYFELIGRLR